jgi:hypothetical protein
MNAFTNEIARIAAVDLFKRGRNREVETGLFVARPFSLDYDRAYLLVADAWKQRARGIPQGTFLLAYYENEDGAAEADYQAAQDAAAAASDQAVADAQATYDAAMAAAQEAVDDALANYSHSAPSFEGSQGVRRDAEQAE